MPLLYGTQRWNAHIASNIATHVHLLKQISVDYAVVGFVWLLATRSRPILCICIYT